MKKTIILTMALALTTFGVFAQQENSTVPQQSKTRLSVDERAKMQADKINTTVQLTPEQYAKVLDLTKNFGAQKAELRKAGPATDDTKAKMRSLNQQEAAQLKAILTPEQNTKLEAARKQHQGERPE